jgi:ferric-dicitrate binding protein FerR (iron transport regulator)
MSEDRLERALQEMKEEDVDAGTLEAARARIWENVTNAGSATCAEFRLDFRAYLGEELGGSRRILVEDHLGRCPGCRAQIAEMKGERPSVARPLRSSSRRVQWGALAAAAALLFAVPYLGRDAIDAMMAPGGPRATVVSADGGLYRLAVGSLEAGAAIGERESVRTGPAAHAVLRLADGSMVEVNERTELFVTTAWSGQAIHLQRGDIIVTAAKQRRGRLRVLTRDSIASVKGTVFAVSAGMGGSVVSVVEGSVAVNQPGREVVLSPGEQAASIPAFASSVAEAVSWSPEAEHYLELLGSLAKIERELANFPTELRTNSALLSYLPAGAVVYGTVPNPGVTIGRALALAEEQSAQNATFGAWWNSETGQLLRQLADRVQSVNSLLGDEIVFCASLPGPGEPVPMVMARVQPGRRAALASALNGLFAEAGESPAPYSVSDDLMVVSNTPSNLAWALAHLGQGAGSAFAAAIGERYRRGVGWLVGIDAPPLVTMASGDDAPPVELAGMIGMKYLFLEQRAPAGAEENEVTFAFQGARKGMGSWLADAGSGGAAEYLPADALLAGYVSTREPLQLFEELTAQITRSEPDFERDLATMDERLGAGGFIQNLTAALGTEAALAVTGLSASGPTWVMASLANNPPVIDSSLQKLVETFNAELGPDEQGKRIVFEQESAGGRTWSTMKPGGLPLAIVWTYDRGYMVAGSDRAVAERAIATRNSGFPLVWSPAFLGQLPSSAGLHPSAFAWLNAKGALGILSALAPSSALGELVAGRDPILVVFDGTPEQIHAASRTRVTGLIMDVMLIESLGRATLGQQSDAVPRQ